MKNVNSHPLSALFRLQQQQLKGLATSDTIAGKGHNGQKRLLMTCLKGSDALGCKILKKQKIIMCLKYDCRDGEEQYGSGGRDRTLALM